MGLLALASVGVVLGVREYVVLADAFDAVCDECSELRFRLDDSHSWLADMSEMVDALIDEREALTSDLNGTTAECRRWESAYESMSDQAFGLLDDLVDLRQELADAQREIACLKADSEVQFSGERQAMGRRLYGRQSDVLARRGRRDRSRYYR